MPIAPSNGVEIYYETHGDPSDPALLLVNGYGAQIVNWSVGLREGLAGQGFHVISLDNRDVGLSTHLHDAVVDVAAVIAASQGNGEMPPVPYTLSAFAADAVGVLDHLGIAAAHVMGASMGGMIVQTIAIEHPTRVLSLISVMSTTGEPDYFQSEPEASAALARPLPEERDAYIADAVQRSRLFSSPRYFDADDVARKAGLSFDRSFDPAGRMRQLTAIRASAPRAEALRALRVPTLVVHGRADTLILPSGGLRTAELIPGANLLLLHDMGHDLPRPLWPLLFDAVRSHCTHRIG